MSEVKDKPAVYVIGGPVQAGKGIYITRKADEELLKICRLREFAYVLTPRQMGKSSLMERTVEHLRREGVRTVKIDLNQIGTEVTEEQWYLGILAVIESDLELETNIFDWWDSHEKLGTVQRLTLFFRDVMLKEVKEPVVIFIDEIDSTLSLPFTDDLFAAVRYLYHARVENPEFERLTFVLIGVATPSDLIKDPKRTPFNIGHRIDLTDFTFTESLPLAHGLGLPPAETEQIHRWVLEWTNGYPYLTQRLYRAIAESRKESLSKDEIDALVTSNFFGQMSRKDSNLQIVRDMLTKRAPDVEDVLTTYREILRNKRPVADEEQSVIKSHLKLSGVVCADGGVLRVRNRIYREVFNEQWVREHLPINWRKRLTKVAAILIAMLFILSLPTAAIAIYQWKQATKSAAEANKQKQAAEQFWHAAEAARTEAERERDRANNALEAADRARVKAEDAAERETKAKEQEVAQRLIAEKQEKAAIVARQEAERERQFADAAKQRALLAAASERKAKEEVEEQRKIAEQRRVEAEKQRSLAEARRVEAEEQRNIADRLREEALVQAETAKDLHRKAVGSQLASEAVSAAKEPGLLQQSVLLASASLGIRYSAPAYQALADGLKLLPKPLPPLNHKGVLSGVAFSPDGKYVVTLGKEFKDVPKSENGRTRVSNKRDSEAEGSLWVWERDSGREITLEKPIKGIIHITTSLSGQYLATINNAHMAQVWKWENNILVESGQPIQLFGDPQAFAVSQNGRYLAAAPEQAKSSLENKPRLPESAYYISIWDVAEHKPIPSLPISNAGSLAFGPEDSLLIAEDDGIAQVWNIKGTAPQEIAQVKHSGYVYAVAFSRDGKYFATAGSDSTVKVWMLGVQSSGTTRPATAAVGSSLSDRAGDAESLNAPLFATISLGPEEYARKLAFSPDGNYLATLMLKNSARIWFLYLGIATERFRLIHDDAVLNLAFSNDGKYVATVSNDNLARTWDVSAPGEDIISGSPRSGMDYRAYRKPYIISSSGKGQVKISSIFQDQAIRELTDASDRIGDELSENGKYVSTINKQFWEHEDEHPPPMDYPIKIWEVETGQRLSTITIKNLENYQFSDDGKYVGTLNVGGVFQLWDSIHGREVEFTKEKYHVEGFAFSPTGQYLALGVLEGNATTVRLLEIASGRPVMQMKAEGKIKYFVFSPDGQYLAASDPEDSVYLWTTLEGKRIPIPVVDKVSYCFFSPNGRYLVGMSREGERDVTLLWETQTGRQIARFEYGSRVFTNPAFSQDEEYLALSNNDGIHILLSSTGCEVARIKQGSRYNLFAFSPDNKYLIGRSDSGFQVTTSKIFWQAAELRKLACTRVTRNLNSEEWHNQYRIEAELPRICQDLPENPDTSAESDLNHCNVTIK